MLNAETLRQLLDYDPVTGVFTWKRRHEASDQYAKQFNMKFVGMRAGRASGVYEGISIYGVIYLSHRLAWLYVTAAMPRVTIDHINGNPRDNRFSNLREATSSQNSWNAKVYKTNKTGLKGVVTLSNPRGGRPYRAVITRNGKSIILGYFDTAEEAHIAYACAAKIHHGEFARVA